METLSFIFPSEPAPCTGKDALCGVVGSGNLEVLIQHGNDPRHCHFSITTAARGFGEIWHAVLESFAASHPCGGARITVNDLGATPAVATLRLAQTLQDYSGLPA